MYLAQDRLPDKKKRRPMMTLAQGRYEGKPETRKRDGKPEKGMCPYLIKDWC